MMKNADINNYINWKDGQYLNDDCEKLLKAQVVDYSCRLQEKMLRLFRRDRWYYKTQSISSSDENSDDSDYSDDEAIKSLLSIVIDTSSDGYADPSSDNFSGMLSVDDITSVYFNIPETDISNDGSHIHGSMEVFKVLSYNIKNCIDPYVLGQLEKIKALLDKLLYLSKKTDYNKIVMYLEDLKELKSSIEEYMNDPENKTEETFVTNLKRLLKLIPYLTTYNGIFYASANKITIYTRPIAKDTETPEEFNALFWSTIAHETFHAFHFMRCNKDLPYWCDDDSIPSKDDMFPTDGIPCLSPDIDNIFDGNGFPSIVKESLASYFEYYEDIYEFNRGIPGIENVAHNMRDAWHRSSPLNCPYAGAKVFEDDKDQISNNDSLFATVFYASLTDWKQARDIILSKAGNE